MFQKKKLKQRPKNAIYQYLFNIVETQFYELLSKQSANYVHAQMLLFLSKNNKKNLLHINQYPQKLVEYKVNKFIEFHKYTIENSKKTNKLI